MQPNCSPTCIWIPCPPGNDSRPCVICGKSANRRRDFTPSTESSRELCGAPAVFKVIAFPMCEACALIADGVDEQERNRFLGRMVAGIRRAMPGVAAELFIDRMEERGISALADLPQPKPLANKGAMWLPTVPPGGPLQCRCLICKAPAVRFELVGVGAVVRLYALADEEDSAILFPLCDSHCQAIKDQGSIAETLGNVFRRFRWILGREASAEEKLKALADRKMFVLRRVPAGVDNG